MKTSVLFYYFAITVLLGLSSTLLFTFYLHSTQPLPFLENKRNETALHVASYNEDFELFWFVQITDLHLSYQHLDRLDSFSFMCSDLLPLISPSFIFITGDITDAKINGFGTQIPEEWNSYFETLQRFNLLNSTFWFDIRGNHDCFNLGYEISANKSPASRNYYLNSTASGILQRNYSFFFEFQNYYFVAVDLCPDYGNIPPFNFFGKLTKNAFSFVKGFFEAKENELTKNVIFLTHYPLAVFGKGEFQNEFQELLKEYGKNILFFLSGHLHSFFDIGNSMYIKRNYGESKQSEFWDLELADFKINRKFRIMSLDDGNFNFIDVKLEPDHTSTYPIIMITNPKHSDFLLVSETAQHDSELQTNSSQILQIRVLVWSDSTLDKVELAVGPYSWAPMHKYVNTTHPINNLYMFNLQLSKLWAAMGNTGHLRVRAVDAKNRTRIVSQQISLDGTPTDLRYGLDSIFGYLVFNDIHLENILKGFFFVMIFLLLIGIWTSLEIAKHRKFFKLFFLELLALCIGPWFLGVFVRNDPAGEQVYGLFFIYGILYLSPDAPLFLDTPDTYLFGCLVLMGGVVPVLLYFELFLRRTKPQPLLQGQAQQKSVKLSLAEKFVFLMFAVQWLVVWVILMKFIYTSYGLWCLLMSPPLSGFLCCAIYFFITDICTKIK